MVDFFSHPSAIIDTNVSIGSGTKIWHFSHISRDVIIGDNCIIGQNVFIGEKVVIGNNCKIQNNVSIFEGVILEDFVFCGPSVVFTNVKNPRSAYPKNKDFSSTIVGKGATLGANSTIICPCTLGEYSFIGAGSVLTTDVLDHLLVYGNPAKPKGWMCKCGQKLSLDRKNPGSPFNCSCGSSYKLTPGGLKQI